MAHHEMEMEHGTPEEISIAPAPRLMRPLTAAEKLAATNVEVGSLDSSSTEVKDDTDEGNDASRRATFLARVEEIERTQAQRFGVERDAIERRLPEDRIRSSWRLSFMMMALWASATMNATTFAYGFLGWQLGLSLTQSILVCIFASLLGAAAPAFCATMGPPSGLRQLSLSRYSLGRHPNTMVALLNAATQIVRSVEGCVIGGVVLAAVPEHGMSPVVGIIVVALVSSSISFFGLKILLAYEPYAWLAAFFVFVVTLGETGRHAEVERPATITGIDRSGALLTLFGAVFSLSARWAPLASDYSAFYSTSTSRTQLFSLTLLSIAISTSLALVAGCVVSSGISSRSDWQQIYSQHGPAAVLTSMLYPHKFSGFLVTLLGLSSIAANVMYTYSAAISLQQSARPLGRIPRTAWTLICISITLAISLGGRGHLLPPIRTLASILTYWTTSYFVIVASEHIVFRRSAWRNYDLANWNDSRTMPVGLAAGTAFALGVVGWIVGMRTEWWTGPVARLIGPQAGGGDVANELSFVLTLLTFVPLRYLELKFVGR